MILRYNALLSKSKAEETKKLGFVSVQCTNPNFSLDRGDFFIANVNIIAYHKRICGI